MKADSIWIGGDILTLDPDNPRAQAMAAYRGRLVAVGSDRDISHLRRADTRVHDLRGQLTMPGLVESHTHALWGACRSLYDIYVGFEASLAELLEAVRERCGRNAPDQVVFGGPWRQPMREEMGDSPRHLLDAISREHSIVLHDASQHILWCNTRALERAGISRSTPDPPSGVIEREADGAPNGLLAETASAPARALVARSAEQLSDAFLEAQRLFHRLGITAFKEPMAFEEELRTYHRADQQGLANIHMAAHIVHSSPLGGNAIPFDTMDQWRRRYRSENLRLDYAKLFLDGVAPGFTASFIEPYLASSGYRADTHDPDATLLIAPAALGEMLAELDRRGYLVKMHAVGDNAVRKGLDAIAHARAVNGPSGLRHEIAHANFVADADLPRFRALSAVAEQSPKMWYPNPGTEVQRRLLGEERLLKNHRIGDLCAAGAELIYGSDWPAAAPDADPWVGLAGMLTRRNPDPNYPGELAPQQAIGLASALPIFTVNGARALGMEDDTGTLRAGKCADFITLDRDITRVSAPEIARARPTTTVWKGTVVYAD